MKTLFKILLSIVFVFVLLLFFLSLTFRIQILSSNFLINTFEKANVYVQLEKALEAGIDEKSKDEELSSAETKVYKEIISPSFLQDIIEGNLKYTLSFINGKQKEVLIYIPFSKFPKGLLPRNFIFISEAIPLNSLLSYLGRGEQVQVSYYQQAASLGKVSTSLIVVLAFICLGIVALLYKLTDVGKRFTWVSIPLIISSMLILAISGIANVIRINMNRDLLKEGSEPAEMIIGTLAPPLIVEITKFWSYLAIAILVTGIILIFVRRPR